MSVGGLEAASIAFKRGDLKQCVEISTQGIQDAQAEGNEIELWWFRCMLAQGMASQGRYQEALSWVETDELSGALDLGARTRLMIQRAFYLTQTRNYFLAKNILDEVASLARAAGEQALLGEIAVNRMTLFFYLAEYDSMEECARSALAIAEQQRLALLEGWAASGIGKSFMVRSRFQQAIPWYERAHRIFVRDGIYLHASQMRSELGCCYYGLQEDEKALELFSEALQVSLDAGAMPSYQIDLANIGNIHLRRGEYAAAISNYQKAANIARELDDWISVSKWLKNLAIAYSQMGNPTLSAIFQQQAENAHHKVEEARSLVKRMPV